MNARTPFSRVLMLAAGLLSICCGIAVAATIPHEEAQVQIWVPDGWVQKSEGADLTAQTPKGDISIVYSVIEAENLKTALDQAEADIRKEVGEFEISEPKEKTHNGMQMLDFDGTAMEGRMDLSISLFKTPSGKILAIYAFAAAGSVEKHQDDLIKMISEVKPLDTDSARVSAPGRVPALEPVTPNDEPEPVGDGPAQSVESGGQMAPWAKGDSFYMNADNVNLRAEPNTNSATIMVIKAEQHGGGEVLGTGPKEVIGNHGANWWIKV
ncbi:MAG TPA: hypothetical protein PKO06_23325, partial [Candidatus Ozemobacteraceae bacterium]|nr:hypothetical protein [Candidatus Ozemobacteraceae bacterium]